MCRNVLEQAAYLGQGERAVLGLCLRVEQHPDLTGEDVEPHRHPAREELGPIGQRAPPAAPYAAASSPSAASSGTWWSSTVPTSRAGSCAPTSSQSTSHRVPSRSTRVLFALRSR
ncbi:hypothetical protein [Terrabacter sp. Soil810]|uniref:hypothetical protein n=1 Tax=Terrabacter sp. Soil810 TaxID=1736418 RepID=UPI00070EF662|nr:hypothetical protein [Terrabacter sp. Soil810]KRF40410.1 hypothetical protein ASG96_05850 [Terrabacter sp. Soil810]